MWILTISSHIRRYSSREVMASDMKRCGLYWVIYRRWKRDGDNDDPTLS